MVLYWSARDASVSNGWTLIATQPGGGGQEVGGGGRVSVGVAAKDGVATLGNILVITDETKTGICVGVSVELATGI